MKVVCWSMKMKLIIWQSFLSFLQSWKQTMNEISTSFALFFIFAILMIVSNSRKTKTIVILFLLLDCDLINRDFDQIDRNHRNLNCICKVRFEFDFYFFVWEMVKTMKVVTDLKSAYSQQLVKIEKNENVIFVICQTGWNSLAIGLAECLKLIAIKQTTGIQQNKTNDDFDNGRTWFFFSSFSKWEKCGFV